MLAVLVDLVLFAGLFSAVVVAFFVVLSKLSEPLEQTDDDVTEEERAVHGCASGACGGVFRCVHCERLVGYCLGCADDIDLVHGDTCDDCADELSDDDPDPGDRKAA